VRRWLGALTAVALASGAVRAQGPEPPPLGRGRPAVTSAGPWPIDLALGGFLQADGVLLDQRSEDELSSGSGEPLNEDRYLIRRARVRVAVDAGWVGGAVELDANTVRGMAAGLTNAQVDLRVAPGGRPPLVLSLGLLRIPFGAELAEQDQDRLFLEHSNAIRALFPGTFDLGVGLAGRWRAFEARLALMNGEPLGEASFPARDPNAAKDLVGRIGLATAVARGVGLALGVSGLRGRGLHRGTPATKDVLVWRDQNEDGIVQLSEIEAVPGSAATPSSSFTRFALGADGEIAIGLPRLGALVAFGELVWSSNLDRALRPADPVATGRDLRERGWLVGLTQELTARAALGVRYDRYDPDADASEQRATRLVPVDPSWSSLTLTAAWRWVGQNRVTLEYQHNGNALGRSPSGAPTTLAADTLTVRGQVAF
jgi:hypothetical protein